MTKVIGIVGSARKGNGLALTKAALDGAAEAGAETELIRLADLEIKPCIDCGYCKAPENKYCVQKDAMNAIFDKIEAADSIIFSTPVYFGRESAEFLLFVDRMYAMARADFSSKLPKDKKFGTIVTIGSMGEEVAESIHQTEARIFGGMFGWTDCGLFWKNMMHAKDAAEKNPEIIAEAKAFGKKFV
ncbi:MAG TPA: flavodoxin family protein [Methanocorpusculum sp.]|nr:flavodoxin family protein [Methanocorpusculum sp.]